MSNSPAVVQFPAPSAPAPTAPTPKSTVKRRKQQRVRPQVGTIREHHGAYLWLYYSEGKKVSEKLGRVGEIASKSAAVEIANQRLASGGGPVKARQLDGTPRSGNALLIDIAEKYLDAKAEQGRRKATVAGYRQYYNTHVKAHLGSLRACDYQPWMAAEFFDSLAKGGKLNINSIKHVKAVLSGVFAYAVQRGYANNNPIKALGKLDVNPAKAQEETEAYTTEETATILAAFDADATAKEHAILALALRAGLRRAEIAGLQWSDFDAAGGILSIQRSAWEAKANDAAKTACSVRRIPLLPDVATSLRRWVSLAPQTIKGWMFESCAGNPMNLRVYAERRMKPLFIANGIESLWKGYHAGRRGFATMLRAQGVDEQTIADYLGHANVAVTRQHYVKPVFDVMVEALAALSVQTVSTANVN